MEEKIYLIIKHDFDNLENRDAHEISHYGYIESEELAKEFIENYNSSALYSSNNVWCKKYKGWDKKIYPYLSYKEIEKIAFYKIV